MRLTTIQKALWAAAALALLVWGGWLAFDGARPTSGMAEALEVEPFRPAFALSDASGRLVTSGSLRGRYLLVFFGFTNCPDVCPTTLSEVAQVMDDLGDDAGGVQPVFISVDPARDRADLATYTGAFHPEILGLAGDEAQTRAAADSFKVYYAREEDASAPDGYAMSHSPALYLIGPEGDWLRQYDYGTPAADILADLRSRL